MLGYSTFVWMFPRNQILQYLLAMFDFHKKIKRKYEKKKINTKIIKIMYSPLLRLFTFYYGIYEDKNVVAFCLYRIIFRRSGGRPLFKIVIHERKPRP